MWKPGLRCHGEAGPDSGDAANLWSGHPANDPVPLFLRPQQVLELHSFQDLECRCQHKTSCAFMCKSECLQEEQPRRQGAGSQSDAAGVAVVWTSGAGHVLPLWTDIQRHLPRLRLQRHQEQGQRYPVVSCTLMHFLCFCLLKWL